MVYVVLVDLRCANSLVVFIFIHLFVIMMMIEGNLLGKQQQEEERTVTSWFILFDFLQPALLCLVCFCHC